MTSAEFEARFGNRFATKPTALPQSPPQGAPTAPAESGTEKNAGREDTAEYDLLLSIDPVAAPRQSRRDAYDPCPAVQRYRAYQNRVRFAVPTGFIFPAHGAHVIFTIAMPRSWSAKKRQERCGCGHTQKPDVDNLAKALLDTLHTSDQHIWDMRITKVWGMQGSIVIRPAATMKAVHSIDIQEV